MDCSPSSGSSLPTSLDSAMAAYARIFASLSFKRSIRRPRRSLYVSSLTTKYVHQQRNFAMIADAYSISPKCEIISPTICTHLYLTTLFFATKPFNNQVNNLATNRVVEFSSSSSFLFDTDDEAALVFASAATRTRISKSERLWKTATYLSRS
jgi:hypothetical protein